MKINQSLRTTFVVLFVVLSGYNAFSQQQEKYSPPVLSDPESWSLVLLPDPQNYVKFKRNQPILDMMMNWVEGQVDSLNIKMVMCTGDLVEHDDIVNPDMKKMDQTGRQQWQAVSRAFGTLDGKVPYVTATGNHDYNIFSYTHKPKTTHFPEYFPPEKNYLNQRLLREVAPNIYGDNSLENAAYEMRSPKGKPYLFLSIEFAPRDTILSWASALVAQKKYKDHTVILLTHAYMKYTNERIVTAAYDLEGANYGQAIWEKLVYPASNIKMVLSGHIGGENDARKHVAFKTDQNKAGKNVQQMTFNAQAMGGGHYGNGGDGWLRILEFMPDEKTIKVKTFSPFFASSPTTNVHAWRRAAYDEFSFKLD